MIERMRKIDILLFHEISEDFLAKLQSIGLLHIIEKNTDDEELVLKAKTQKKINDLIKLFSSQEGPQVAYDGDMNSLLKEADLILSSIESINNELFNEQRKFEVFKPWGAYSLETVEKLKANKLDLKFYKVSTKIFNKLKLHTFKDIYFDIILRDKATVFFVILGAEGLLPEFKFEEFVFPSGSYQDSELRILELEKNLISEQSKLKSLSKYRDYVLVNKLELENIISYTKAKLSLENNYDKIFSVEAWLPFIKEPELKKFLDNEEALYYSISDPADNINPMNVPILLKNNMFSKLFEPITKLFSLPNYVELDVTPFFAPFFAMFFGLCLGDSGYGLILLAASIFVIIKFKKLRPLGFLGMFFSLATVLWGILTGTFFGIDVSLVKIPGLSELHVFPSSHMFYLALLIGLLQILFGMFVQFFNKIINKGFWNSVSTLGWIILIFFVVGLYLKDQSPAKDFVIGELLIGFYKSISPEILKYGSLVGVLLILLFNDLKAKLPLRIGKGLWELYGITGFFGDLLSYIRLFALGISSAILGTVVNALALSILKTNIPVLSQVIFVVFLLVGHTGNLMLASLGAFVHSLRLTFVEFYKNAGFVGGGKPYLPFAKKDL